MQGINILRDDYLQMRSTFFQWRSRAALAQKIALAFGMACLTGLFAQVKLNLPWTPVPIVTTQLGMVLAAVLLGKWWGGASMIIYAVGGLAGIPWFAGFSGGPAVLFGPTGGYIIGFVLAAFFIGYFSDTYIKCRKFLPVFGIMLFAHLVIVFVPGLLQLGLWLNVYKSQSLTLRNLLYLGYLPFITGDIIKSVIGALVATGLTPKKEYNLEQ